MIVRLHARTAFKAGSVMSILFLLASLSESSIYMVTRTLGLLLPVFLVQTHLGSTIRCAIHATLGSLVGSFGAWILLLIFSGGTVSTTCAMLLIVFITYLFGFIDMEPLFKKFGCIYSVLVISASFQSPSSSPIPFVSVCKYPLEILLSSALSVCVDYMLFANHGAFDFRVKFSDTLNDLHTAWRLLLKGRSTRYREAILARAEHRSSESSKVAEHESIENPELDILINTLEYSLEQAGESFVHLRELLNNARWEEWRHIVWYFTWPLLPTDSFSTSVSNRRLRHYQLALNELYSLHAHLCVMREALLAGCHESVHAQLIQPLELGGTLSHVEATVAHEFMACAFEFARHRNVETDILQSSAGVDAAAIALLDDVNVLDIDSHDVKYAADRSLDLVLRPAQRELRKRSCVDALARLERTVHHAREHSFTNQCSRDGNGFGQQQVCMVPASLMQGAYYDIPKLNTYLLNLRAVVLSVLNVHEHLQSCAQAENVREFSTAPVPVVDDDDLADRKIWRNRCAWCGVEAGTRWATYARSSGRSHCVALLAHAISLVVACWKTDPAAVSSHPKAADQPDFDLDLEDTRTTALRKQCILGLKFSLAISLAALLTIIPQTLQLLTETVVRPSNESAFLAEVVSLKSSAFWVVMTCVLVMESSVGANFRKILLLLFGTILGGASGYLCVYLFVNNVALMTLGVFLFTSTYSYFRHVLPISYGGTTATLTMLIVLQTHTVGADLVQSALIVALRRCIMVFLGCVLAILVNQLVFPQRSRFEIDILLANVLHRFERLYKASSDAFFAHKAPIDGEVLRAEQVASQLLSARHAWAAAMSQRVDSVEIEALPRARVMCFDAVVEPSFGVGTVCLKALARCFPQHAAFLAPVQRTFKFQAKNFVVIIDDLEKLLVWFKLFETCLDHNVEDVATLVRIEQVAPRGSDQAQPEAVGLQHDALFALDVVESMQVALSRLRESSEGILEACASALLTLNNSSLVSMLDLSSNCDEKVDEVVAGGAEHALLRMKQSLNDILSTYERSMGAAVADFALVQPDLSSPSNLPLLRHHTSIDDWLWKDSAIVSTIQHASALHHLPSLNQSFTFSGLVFGSYQFCVDLRRLVSHTADAIAAEASFLEQ